MSTNYCSNCGHQVGNEASFCSHCGRKLSGDMHSPSPQEDDNGQIAKSVEISSTRKQSWIGIASLALGIITAALQFMSILGAGIAVSGSSLEANQNVLAVIGMFICGGLAGHLLGIILGIIGLAQPKHKTLFPILGIAMNAISLLAVIGLILIGNSMPG